MAAAQVRYTRGPTSFTEMARLTGEFADWHNLLHMAMWLDGELNVAALQDAWWRVCLRHDVMRRTYVSADEACTYAEPLSEVELHTAESDAAAVELMRGTIGAPFSLDGPGFSRIVVVQRSERRHLFGIAMDHIVSDLISWSRVWADFIDFYERALVGDAGDVTNANSYQSFASEQRRLFAGEWGEARRTFWRSYISEFGTFPPPFAVGGKHTGEYAPRTVTRELPADAKSRVHKLSLQARATPHAVITSSVLTAMRDVTGEPQVGITVNQHGRMLKGTAYTAGLFVQTVPLHLGRHSRSPLDTVQEVFHRTHDVSEYSLPLRVVGKYWNETMMLANQEPGLSVSLNEHPPTSDNPVPFTGTEAEYVQLNIPGGKRWPETVVVAWNLYETGPELVARYNENRFPRAAVEQLLEAAERFALQGIS
ncbi:condensation domain-containing protein [Streptomyces sp. NPDC002521]